MQIVFETFGAASTFFFGKIARTAAARENASSQ